jgi:hypothetical protein
MFGGPQIGILASLDSAVHDAYRTASLSSDVAHTSITKDVGVSGSSNAVLSQPALDLPRQEEFDELCYLNQHLDVQHAVQNGKFVSGWHHYVTAGCVENRAWRRAPRLTGFDFEAIFASWRAARFSGDC